MNFLHRLHPGRALEPGAVRPDIAPRFAPAAALLFDTPAPAPAATTGGASAAVRTAATVPGRLQPESRPEAPAAVTVANAADAPAPPRTDEGPQRQAARPVPQAAAVHTVERVLGHGVDHVVQHTIDREPRVRAEVAASVAWPDAPVRVAPNPPRPRDIAVQRSAAPRVATAMAPLRAQAVPRAQRAPLPTVVQVSIDRLDVRLPAPHAAAASPAPQRPRAGTAGPTLSDYLRGKSGGAP